MTCPGAYCARALAGFGRNPKGSLLQAEVLDTLIDIGLVPVFYHQDVEVAKRIVAACAVGGARVVEFTNRGYLACQVFSDLVLASLVWALAPSSSPRTWWSAGTGSHHQEDGRRHRLDQTGAWRVELPN